MEQPATASPSRVLTVAQLVVGILGTLLSLGGLIGSSILLLSPNKTTTLMADSSQVLNLSGVLLAVALLTTPSVTTAIRSLAGLPPRRQVRHRFLLATLALLLVPLIILLDGSGSSEPAPNWLSAISNILTILIPIWWFLELGRSRLTGGSAQRQWGLFSFSTFITLPVILVVELVVLGFGMLFGALWLFQQPEFAPILSQFGSQNGIDPTLLDELSVDLIPFLTRPGVIAALAAVVALIIPLIEEMLKPLGLWLLHKRGLSPAEGFTLGLICGAAFALLESLFSISAVMPGERLFVIVGRLGTGLLHIFTAGLNGWALATTWRDGKYARVGISYGLSVLIHGAWNFFALLMGLHAAGDELPRIVDPAFSSLAAWLLAGIALLLLLGLIAFNLHLRREPVPPPLPQTQENSLG